MLALHQMARRATSAWHGESANSIVLTIAVVVAATSAWVQGALLPATYIQSKSVDGHRQLAQSAKDTAANAEPSLARLKLNAALVARPVSLESVTKEMFAALTGNNVIVKSMTYRPIVGRSPAERPYTEINAELKGRYPQIKKALFDILQDHPQNALTAIAVRRTKATDQQLDVQPVFNLFEP